MISNIGYKFRHWAFTWGLDSEGDLVLTVFKVLHLTKYKEHTIVNWGKKEIFPAPKWIKGE